MGLSETIDIPESGAVFTLGKSYLSENHQSYFFIKNDAIRRLICGRNQSAVVCESGRLFVWGENQFGQLGIGANDIVTKPSCVKTIKALGERVRNVAFGEAFAVILTETSKLFYSGRNVFEGDNAAVRERFGSDTGSGGGNGVSTTDADAVLVCRKPFELTDFSDLLLDAEQNVNEHFVDVAAGDEHFVVLTGAGKMFGWGSNAYSQLGGTGGRTRPTLLSGPEPVRVVSCGRKCTAFITAHNTVYILGTSNELQFVSLVSINTSSFEDLMYSIYFSHDDDQIYLVISSGEIFRSAERDGQLHFEPHNVISENIRKICTGAGFVAIVTESNKLLTTFRERSSAHDETGRLRSPRELRKFQKLEVVDAVCGEHHILVHGVQPSALNAVLSSSSNDEADAATTVMNDLNRTYTKSTSLEKDDDGGGGGDSLIQTLKRCLTMKDSRNILSSKIPVFDSRRLSQETMPSSLTNSVEADETDSTVVSEREKIPIEKSTSLNEFEKLEQDEELVDHHNHNDIESKPNNTNGNASKIASPAPTSAGSSKSLAQTVIHRTPALQKLEDFNNNGREPRHSREDNASVSDEQLHELSLQNEMLGLEDELPPDGMNSRQSNEIMFIDNGVEKHVSPSTVGTESVGGGENQEDSVVALEDDASMGKNDEEFENTLLGEKLSGVVKAESVADIKEETMIAVRQAVGEDAAAESTSQKNTPSIRKQSVAKAGDEGSDRTTASIASNASAKNPFENDGDDETADMDNGHTANGFVAVENGRMKRFIREMRSKGRGMSCRNADNVVEETVAAKPMDEEQTVVVERTSDEKTSKVCVIL